jgi:tight adherence protein C
MLLSLVGVFVSVAFVTGSIASMVLSRTTTEQRRLREVTRGPQLVTLPENLSLTANAAPGVWQDLGRLLPRSQKEMGRLRQRLARGGLTHPAAPVIYTSVELLGPVVIAAVPFFLLTGSARWIGVAAAAILTFFAPTLYVERRTLARRREISDGLPDALDLLIVCIEAGSGIDQAILRTADEIGIAYPALGEELRTLNMEIRAGKPRLEAFKNLASRTKVDEVRALVAMLIQTDRFGTSIGQALRTHAETARSKRRQRAEEAAQKIGVKLVFPLVLFFFPAFYVVVLGPAIIQFIRQFMQ